MKNNHYTTLTLAFFVGFALFCQQATGKEEEPYYRKTNSTVYGPVKSVKTTNYAGVDSSAILTETNVRNYTIEEYDRNGFLKVSTSFNTATFAISKETYHQNRKQGLYTTCRYTQSGDLISKSTYIEDKKGHLIEVRSIEGGDTTISSKYEYDERGNLVQQSEFNRDGTLNLRLRYEFDKNNRRKSNSSFRGKNEIQSTDWCYDKKGQMLESKRTTYFKNSVQQSVTRYQYLEKGKVVERKDSSNAGISYQKTFYDKKGKISEMNFESQGLKTQRLFIRNKRGDVVQLRVFSRNVLTALTQYTFDKWGNWIEKAEYDVFRKQKVVTKREIEYYL